MQSLPAQRTGASSKQAWIRVVVVLLPVEEVNLLRASTEGAVVKPGKSVLCNKMVEGLRLWRRVEDW